MSYSHDSDGHSARTLDLAKRLRREGIDCWIDRFSPDPPEGWARWCEKQIAVADFVVLVCTETYCRRFDGEEAPGQGRGVTWEGAVIRQTLYEAQARNDRFIPVMFAGG